MTKEIERKFLVVGEKWKNKASGSFCRQGYLSTVKERTVRVRVIDDMGYLTIKGVSVGARRTEFEYEIPVKDAKVLLDKICKRPIIEKTRYKIEYKGFNWEIDVFNGDNKGLVVAEVELENENQHVELPDWIGEEVTADPKYYNANLINNPFKNW